MWNNANYAFFAAICNVKCQCTVKQLFFIRLYHIYFSIYKSKRGYIPDIWYLFHKYDLQSCLYDYLQSTYIPSKLMWKYIVKHVLFAKESEQWQQRLNLNSDLCRFKLIHRQLSVSILWRLSQASLNLAENCKRVSKLWIIPPDCELHCGSCSLYALDAVTLCLLDCNSPEVISLRDSFYRNIVNSYPVYVYVTLDQAERDDQITTILGRPSHNIALALGDDNIILSFIHDCLVFF